MEWDKGRKNGKENENDGWLRIIDTALKLKWYLALGKVIKEQVRTGPDDDIVMGCKIVRIIL